MDQPNAFDPTNVKTPAAATCYHVICTTVACVPQDPWDSEIEYVYIFLRRKRRRKPCLSDSKLHLGILSPAKYAYRCNTSAPLVVNLRLTPRGTDRHLSLGLSLSGS
jgi:hypothetical protein